LAGESKSGEYLGSDWPVITPDRWLADFAKLEIREEIRPKVLKANARRILGI
jgi:predicted TIM-barrel fold metal-dependent hydrolase